MKAGHRIQKILPLEVLLLVIVLAGCAGSRQSPPSASQTFTLDLGQEMAGQLVVTSSSSSPVHLLLTLGESQEELPPDKAWLGQLDINVSADSSFLSPSTGFRYVQLVTTPSDFATLHFSFQPSYEQLGSPTSFNSGDPQLDQIWQISVRTAQYSLQAGIFDAPKRDRDVFAGDAFITARTARAAWGHASDAIVEQTIAVLAQHQDRFCPGAVDINCIPSYNGWWVLDLADLYRYNHDLAFLQSQKSALLTILQTMQSEMQANLFFVGDPGLTIFADWSPDFVHVRGLPSAAEAIKVGTMVDYMAFTQAAFLFGELGDSGEANIYSQMAANVKSAAVAAYFDPASQTFGNRTQTNAMAIYSGLVDDPTVRENIFQKILSQPPSAPVSPYFNYFVISAMDKSGHHAEAVSFIKSFWGSMVSTGATTFWEMYDPHCVNRPDFHSCLRSYALNFEFDPRLFVSLSHGWASGPAAFLSGF